MFLFLINKQEQNCFLQNNYKKVYKVLKDSVTFTP